MVQASLVTVELQRVKSLSGAPSLYRGQPYRAIVLVAGDVAQFLVENAKQLIEVVDHWEEQAQQGIAPIGDYREVDLVIAVYSVVDASGLDDDQLKMWIAEGRSFGFQGDDL